VSDPLCTELGVMPEAVELRLTVPAELGPEADVLEELRQRMAAAVAAIGAQRQRMGQRVYGATRRAAPAVVGTADELRAPANLRPRVAARSKWARIEALRRNRALRATGIDPARS
jgi:hypothetical protein